MTVLDWTLLRSIGPTLNVEHADESELQAIEDAADELTKLQNVEDVQEVRDLQTLLGVAQKVIKVKTMQAETAIEELETAVKDSGLAQENERLRRELARAKAGDVQDENQLKKLREELDEVHLLLKREQQNAVKFEGLYTETERDRKSLQVEILALQTELDEKIRDIQKQEEHAASQLNEKQVIAKLKEKNDQITKLMLAVQEEEGMNENLRSTIDQLGARLRDATVEINNSADLIEELRETQARLVRQLEQSRRENTTLEGLVDEYMSRINELEAMQPPEIGKMSRSASDDRLETWRGILETKNGEIHDLQLRIVQLQQELDSVLSSTNLSTLKVLRRGIVEKDAQIKSLADSLSQATLDIEDNTRIIETLKGELASKGQSQKDEKGDERQRLRKAEDMNAELEKQLLDREEQLADALLVARKYEMGVYGLSDAVTEVRVCKRKIASRDKNIARLQEQLAESYVEIERLARDNEQLCQGLVPPDRTPAQADRREDSIQAERTILALEEEILTLKQSLRELQRNLVDNVHKVSSDWSPPWDSRKGKASRGSSDEENLDRCQLSRESSKRQDLQETDVENAVGDNDAESENQKLKEFLIQVLEALQNINSQKDGERKTSLSRVPAKRRPMEAKRVESPTPKNLKPSKDVPKDMALLREFVSDVLDENQRLANDLHVIRTAAKPDKDDAGLLTKLFESAQQQVLRQRSLLSVYSGVLAEQLAYVDCLQEVYRRQLGALGGDVQGMSRKVSLSYNVDFDHVADLKRQIHQLNNDIVAIKRTMHDDGAIAAQPILADQTENLFMLEKLRMQIDVMSKHHLKTQKLLTEREGELMQLHEKLRKSQTSQRSSSSAAIEDADADSSVTAAENSDEDDDTIQEESQTESERSISHSFYRKIDALREYNRKLCSELSEARYILKRTEDALNIKEVMLREVNRQQAACGNLEQKISVMEISLETNKKLLGHKEQTLARYRQLVTDLKQDLVSVKVKCSADMQQLEKAHMDELYHAKRQIAELTMKTFHHQQMALDNDTIPDQASFEKILAEKQVQIVQLQNKVKSLSTSELRLSTELGQANESNQRLHENITDLQKRLHALERSAQLAPPAVQRDTPAVAITPAASTEGPTEPDGDGDTERQQEIASLTTKLTAAEGRAARLKTALEQAKDRISSYDAEVEQQNAKIEQLRKIQSLRRTDPKRMKILEDANENLRRQLYEAKQQHAEKPHDEIEKQAKQGIEVARWEESKKWQSVIEGLRKQLKEKDTAIELLETTAAQLRAQIVRLEKEKYKFQDQLKAAAAVSAEHAQTSDALLKRIQGLERTVAYLQKPPRKSRPRENQIVPILVSPRSPRRRKERRSVSFDASVIDNEPSTSEADDAEESRLEDEPMPPGFNQI